MTATPPPPPPGWYPTPDDAATEQWWTGRDWSTECRPVQVVPAPAPVVQPATRPAKRGAGFGFTIVTLLVLTVIVFVVQVLIHLNPTASSSSDAGAAAVDPAAQTTTHEVAYLVTGSAPQASVTLQTPSGTQQHDVQVPMETTDGSDFTFTADAGQFVYLSAQNSGESGDITCTITVDGETVAENTSTGAYGIAQCEASVK